MSARSFQGLLVSSGVFFRPPGRSFRLPGILGEVALWCLYLPAKPTHVGVDVDGLAYPLHWPMVRSR
jgi:hypothetical protein